MHIKPDDPPTGVLAHVAANVRRLRTAGGLSQASLAAASGVSRRTIINLEAGEANVSLSALDHIAAALGATFVDLVAASTAAREAIDEVVWRGATPDSVGTLLGSAPATSEAQLWTWTLGVGDRYDADPDPVGWHELLLVTEGTLHIEREDGTSELTVGGHAIYSSAQTYAYVNGGDGPVQFTRVVVS
ncbi:helix-turn-helix domain-containing protein [Microbacterium sp. NPDC056569]|uniref:helix-turn-helix domain-containing protein n=1 Tax=Microbacterium sp. NPDC056569 TaxID=3345867 RepID=UPI003670C9E0